MAKSYEVLHDTWLRGRRYASGSQAILGDEDAAGYARAGLIKSDEPLPEPIPLKKGGPEVTVICNPDDPVYHVDVKAPPTHEKSPKKKKHPRD